MNIFVLHQSAGAAANAMTDRHINKMLIESGQILSTAVQMLIAEHDEDLFRVTHMNHPCVKWAMHSVDNAAWLLDHYDALYFKFQWLWRKEPFDRPHQAYRIRQRLDHWIREDIWPRTDITVPPCCMPEKYIVNDGKTWQDVIDSYRWYYVAEKIKADSYRRNKPPYWARRDNGAENWDGWGDLDALEIAKTDDDTYTPPDTEVEDGNAQEPT